ncbi:hypothetical protein B7494_g5889 [Chlorociboria aeruginascens]|nr:hypothetical protein B7494_g5889 [Chlorociboria aeruginascens]
MLTFLSHLFRKPINRLVFYASLGNMFTNVATLIAVAAMDDPNSAACQLQGFLIQMFMPADAYWTLAMAMNVFLTFRWHYGASELRNLEKWYAIGCYGVPLVPALVYVFAVSGSNRHMYGNATLWCWLSPEWDILRILTFYMPVWIAIMITLGIYIWAGRIIFNTRTELQIFIRPRSRQCLRSTHKSNAGASANTAAWSYTKVAFLFFVALMVTWVPSSANRVYSLAYPGRISIPLEFASALVLPLQGFWNTVVYILTSWDSCKQLWHQLTDQRRTVENGFHNIDAGGQNFDLRVPEPKRSRPLDDETRSISELADRHTISLSDC